MKTKTQKLKELFVQWEKEQENEDDKIWKLTNGGNNNISKSHFRRDGIIDEETFSKEKRKILFISNEANDNDYSAKENKKPDNTEDYLKYYHTGNDDWKGKMRERTSALYKFAAGIGIEEMSNSDAAIHYAVMDLNKRGGGADIHGGNHIEEYCKHYRKFIRKEIEIINPDIIIWLGTQTFKMDWHVKYLGAERNEEKVFFYLGDEKKKVPVIQMWHTSYFEAKIQPLEGYSDKIIGKLCAKLKEEMGKYGILNDGSNCMVHENISNQKIKKQKIKNQPDKNRVFKNNIKSFKETNGETIQLSRENLEENILIIKVGKSYRAGMTDLELYDITRGCWRRRIESVKEAEYVLSVYKKIVIEVYKVSGWFKAEEIERKTIPYSPEADVGRIIFEGEVAEDAIRKKYIGKSVAALYKRGEADPVKAFFKDKNI